MIAGSRIVTVDRIAGEMFNRGLGCGGKGKKEQTLFPEIEFIRESSSL